MRTNQADVIDVNTQTGKVTSLPPMEEARGCHVLTAAGSLVFAFGGWIEPGGIVARTFSCELFDSCTNT